MLTLEQGKQLIDVAREVILAKLKNKRYSYSSKFGNLFGFKTGCFVTLRKNNTLRGCMGLAEPDLALIDALVYAAERAAFYDPRFPPVDAEEVNAIAIQVDILTRPRLVMVRNPEEYLNQIQIGIDGIMVKGIWEYGVLLPQMAVEYGWNVAQFLTQACIKAGLQPDAWQNFNLCTVYKFQSEVFIEQMPKGQVEVVVNG